MKQALFPSTRPRDLDREVDTLQQNYGQIIKNLGKYVLISGESVVAYFDTYRAAIAEGYKRFGLGSFLVRLVSEQDVPIRAMRCGVARMGSRLRIARSKKT